MQESSFKGKVLIDVVCPTCGDNGRRKIHKYLNIEFFQCNQCGIEYASPRLSEIDLLGLYQGDEWRDYKAYKNWTYKDWTTKKDKTFFLVNENLRLVSQFLHEGSTILDVGSDIGLSVRHLNENGFKAEGIEVSEVASKIANEIVQASTVNSELKNFQNSHDYDGLLLRAVLEHLDDPIGVLKDCANKLKPNGLIFIDVPHYKGLSTRFKKFLHTIRIKKNYKHFGFPAHLYSFDKRSLKYMLREAGFNTIFFESWPKAITTGKVNCFNRPLVELQRKYCLSDYINVVAKKI